MIVESRDVIIGGVKFKSAPIKFDDDKIIMWDLIDLKIADLMTQSKKFREYVINDFKGTNRYNELINSDTHIGSVLREAK